MLKIDVHPDVYAELEDSRSWYEERARNLGTEFIGAMDIQSTETNAFSDEDISVFVALAGRECAAQCPDVAGRH